MTAPPARLRVTRAASTAVAAVAVLLLGACGGSDDAETGPTSEAAAASTTASTISPVAQSAGPTSVTPAAETTLPAPPTRTVQHELGTSEVPIDPQRIVVVDRRGTLAFLLELGFEPVGAIDASWLFGEPFHPLIAEHAEAAGVEAIDDTDGPNVEQIAALQPDLIIGNVRDMGETPDQLAQIAPTVGLSWNFSEPLANALAIGEVVGRGDRAQAMIDEFDALLTDAKARVGDPGTVSIVGLFAIDDIRIYRAASLYGRLTEELGGVVVPDESQLASDPEDPEVNFVSLEEIGLASGDRLISLVTRAPETIEVYEGLRAEALVQALPSFRSGQVIEADSQLSTGAAGANGLAAMLEQLVEFYGG